MEQNLPVDIKKYWQIVYARRYICIAVSLLVLSVIVWGSYFIPAQYEAKCTVFIERNIINALVKNLAMTPSIEDRLRVISEVMKSRNLLLKVVDELDFNMNRQDPVQQERLVKSLQERTQIKMVKGGQETDWFSVTFKDGNPKLARDYVNTLVRRYIEENVSSKRDETYEANKFLVEQRKFFKEKLDNVEERISNFRMLKGIFVSIDERSIVGEIKSAEQGLEAIRIQKSELEAKKSLTEKQIKEEKPYTIAMMGRSKGDTLQDRLFILQNKLNDLMVKFTDNYPEVIKVKAEMEILKKQIQDKPSTAAEENQGSDTEMTALNPLHQKLKEDLTKIDSDLAALSAKERFLKSLNESKIGYLKDIPAEKKILAELERERDTYKKIDDEFTMKIGQSEVSKQMEIQDKTETFRILDPAILPTTPVSPNRVVLILFGIVAGIGAGIGTVLLIYYLDHSVKTVDELKALIKFPVLAIIPQIISEEEISKKNKMDRRVYAGSLAYLAVIVVIFIKEAIVRFL